MSDGKYAMPGWPAGGFDPELDRLQGRYFPCLGAVDLAGLLTDPALQDMVTVSSFGAESAALLHYVSTIRPEVPVAFLDTGQHFFETLSYRDVLVRKLGLNLVIVRPDARLVAEEDADEQLHVVDPNACCTIRKTFPLQDYLEGFACWISGRKRFQGATREALPLAERDGKRIKLNPFAFWTRDDIGRYFEAHDLPRHPLQDAGYPSIGCKPCTRAVAGGEAARAGRWPHMPDKTECGIHLAPDGRFLRNGRTKAGPRDGDHQTAGARTKPSNH